MKKLCLIAGLISVMVMSAFGQGQVTVQNFISPGDPNNAIIGDTNGVPLAGGTYLVDLLYGSSPSSLTQDAGLAIAFLPSGSGLAGFFAADSITLASGFTGTVSFELVVWQAAAGVTWAAATGGGATPSPSTYLGNGGTEWGMYTFTLSGINNTSPTSIAQGPGSLQAFDLVPVPEPTTLALMGLGGLSLLLYRRRK